MSGRDIRDTVGLVAVVAGLVFVGMEIRQSAAATRGATQHDLQASIIALNLTRATDSELADLLFRAQSFGTIGSVDELSGFTGGELGQVQNFYLAAYRVYEEAYYQFTLGNLDPEVWAGWEANINDYMSRGGGLFWPILGHRFSESYRTFMDNLVQAGTVSAN